MNLLMMIFYEGLLIAAAGMTFISGIRGMVIAGGLVSIINFFIHKATDFWKWEGVLFLGFSLGILVLIGLEYKAGKVRAITGLIGGIISLVLFGVFFTPVLALVLWGLIIGMGLKPNQSQSMILWSFAPTLCRAVLGLGWIILGNYFYPY
ncbi:MAG: hypothetical protein PHZ11_02855 [Desulfitobacteriaceae bacterium]|nr:hypothetical protein [Desulfitobacteriaceae bacterium]MDD4345832.1 hypothetical protein [Desulfitobacteriaceae bacterium]MDD4401318.1 hypothetical protein [Desulfitobacteriaceae bacterium]